MSQLPRSSSLPPEVQATLGRRIGVRSFLFIVLSLCTSVPICLFGFSQARRGATSERAAADRQAFAAAQSAANQLAVAMLGYVHATESFAAQVAAGGDLHRATLERVMDAHRAPHPEFIGAYVADKNGAALLNESAIGEFLESHINYADRDYYSELLRTQRAVVSRATIGRVTRVLSIQVVAPIFDEQKALIGFTCSSVDLGKLANRVQQSARGMTNGRIVVIDSVGQLVADSQQKGGGGNLVNEGNLALFAAASTAGEIREGTDELHQRVRGVAVGLPDPIAGWRAVAIMPKAAIEANARRMMLQTATVALALSLVMLALAAWLAGWISRPLRALAATTLAVSKGEFSLLPRVLRGLPHEMAQLTWDVRSMISRLSRHAQELESEVAARTESLSRANRELTRAIATISENEERLREDIAKARMFQEKMLPTIPQRTDVDIATSYRPLHQVSGDIFDVADVDKNHLRLFVADATGHGVQASMRTILLKSAYERIKYQHMTPSAVLEALNHTLVQQFPDGDLHCAASCVDLHFSARGIEVVYANAANGPLFVFSPDQPPLEVYEAGPLLGVDLVEIPSFSPITLRTGQLLFMASDGLIEQQDPRHHRFEVNLKRMLLDKTDTADSFGKRVLDDFDRFRETQPVADDITFIAVRFPLGS